MEIGSFFAFGNFWDTREEMFLELSDLGMSKQSIEDVSKAAEVACTRSAKAAAANYSASSLVAVSVVPAIIPKTLEVLRLAAASAPNVESVKTRLKLEAALEGIWEILIAAGPHSKLLEEANSLTTVMQAQMRSYLFREWADMPHGSLRSYVNGWKAWADWCKAEGVDLYHPKRIHFVLFFDNLKLKGATAAKGKFNALRWLTAHLELDLQLDNAMVKEATRTSASHIEKQVPPMRITF